MNLDRKWSVIDAANKHPDFLNYKLKIFNFRGTTDVAIVDRDLDCFPSTGLKVRFELKKNTGLGFSSRARFQTMVSLMLANVHSRFLKPVAMLTDLVDDWVIFWMDQLKIHFRKFETRSMALGYLEDLLRNEAAALPAVSDSSDEMRPISKRRKFSLPEMEQLEDFVGIDSDEAIHQDRVNIALKHLLQNPVVSALCTNAQVSPNELLLEMYS